MNALSPIAAPHLPDVRSTARSHVGRVRAINEDRVLDGGSARLWAVADGMGGHAGGDVAAQAVIDRLRALTLGPRAPNFIEMLVALGQANGDIMVRNESTGSDAGATIVAALLDGGTMRIAWAGDSRAYRLRKGALERLTRDHSVVQDLIDARLLSEDQAEQHPHAHVVTRALGVAHDPGIETAAVSAMPGDRFLLCSDGLSRSFVPGEDWSGAGEALADRLLAAALERDGRDNISLVLIDID